MVFQRVVKPLRWLWNGPREQETLAGEQTAASVTAEDNARRESIRSSFESLLDVALVLDTYLPLLPGAAENVDQRVVHAVEFCGKVLDNAAQTVVELREEPRAQTIVPVADELIRAFRSYREKLAANAEISDPALSVEINADRQRLRRAASDLRDAIERRLRQLDQSGRS